MRTRFISSPHNLTLHCIARPGLTLYASIYPALSLIQRCSLVERRRTWIALIENRNGKNSAIANRQLVTLVSIHRSHFYSPYLKEVRSAIALRAFFSAEERTIQI